MINGAASQSNIKCTDLTWPIVLKTEQSKEGFPRSIQQIEIMASRVVTWMTWTFLIRWRGPDLETRSSSLLSSPIVSTHLLYTESITIINQAKFYKKALLAVGKRRWTLSWKTGVLIFKQRWLWFFPSRNVLITQMCAVFRLTWCWISVHLRTYIHSRLYRKRITQVHFSLISFFHAAAESSLLWEAYELLAGN